VNEKEAARLRAQIAKLQKRLHEAEHTSDHLSDSRNTGSVQPVMTEEQNARRGRAVAAAVAAKSRDRVLLAIVASEWRTQASYARKRLGVTPAALGFYRTGAVAIPRALAEIVRGDLGIPLSHWKKVVD
jgi:exosome complex RNA-binding protein Csl4